MNLVWATPTVAVYSRTVPPIRSHNRHTMRFDHERNAISTTTFLGLIILLFGTVVHGPAMHGRKLGVSAFVVTNMDFIRLTKGKGTRRKRLNGDDVFHQDQHPLLIMLSSRSPSSSRNSARTASRLKYSESGNSNNNNNSAEDGDTINNSSSRIIGQIAVTYGILAQPVVWISLYNVATTGGGLPAGPFGLLGAIEGLSYLAVLGWVVASFLPPGSGGGAEVEVDEPRQHERLIYKISRLTLVVAIATLLSLVVDRGCVPNAKPILDYSAYLPICDTVLDTV